MPVDWTVNGTQTNGLIGEQPALTPGESSDFAFGFYSQVGEPTTHVDRYNAVREYAKFAGQFVTYETIDGDIFWYEQREGASPLVHLVPPDDSPTGREIWGLIESMEDATTLSQARCELSLSIIMIAPGGPDTDEFATEDEIRSVREATGP
jgi:hypothetical protein